MILIGRELDLVDLLAWKRKRKCKTKATEMKKKKISEDSYAVVRVRESARLRRAEGADITERLWKRSSEGSEAEAVKPAEAKANKSCEAAQSTPTNLVHPLRW